MIVFSIIVAGVILLGSLTAYVSISYAEHKGYMRGLEEAEEIIDEVRNNDR